MARERELRDEHPRLGRPVLSDRLLGVMENVEAGGGDGGLEGRPYGRRDHPRHDGARLQDSNDLRDRSRADVTGRERARRDRPAVDATRPRHGCGQIRHQQLPVHVPRRRDLEHLRRDVDPVDRGESVLAKPATGDTGTATEVDDRCRSFRLVLGEQLDDAVRAAEGQRSEDIVVVVGSPLAIDVDGIRR